MASFDDKNGRSRNTQLSIDDDQKCFPTSVTSAKALGGKSVEKLDVALERASLEGG